MHTSLILSFTSILLETHKIKALNSEGGETALPFLTTFYVTLNVHKLSHLISSPLFPMR